jgi:hypothetical protein
MMSATRLVPALLGLAILAGCSDSNAVDSATIKPDPAAGQFAFEQSCSTCHSSHDGFDVKTFGFSDTTIVRRAVKHVDSATARSIAAYIRGLNAPQIDQSVRLFQPRGAALTSDVDFANALFGQDAWPANLTTAQLAAIDPRNVQVAIQLPRWADENSNMDWMPDNPLPAGILNYSGSAAAAAIAGYDAAPTKENLVRAVAAIRNADHAVANNDAPCLLEDTIRVRYRECFETRRWTSTLVANFMLRNGVDASLGAGLQDVWWDVGNAARKSRNDKTAAVDNAVQNWAAWMFLGWSFDPSQHSTTYTGGSFMQLALPRHATFVALRSQVARPKNSMSVYEDAVNAVKFAPTGWATAVASFGLKHLNERLTAGDGPTAADQVALAKTQVSSLLTESSKKVSAADRAKLDILAQPVLAALASR